LAAHLGLHIEGMRKAAFGEVDPRYPELSVLIDAARRDWDRWGARLAQEVEKQLLAGKLLPMTLKNEKMLRSMFREHHVRITMLFAGHPADGDMLEQLQRKGLIAKELSERSRVAVAYKLGRGLQMLEAHRVQPDDLRKPSLESILKKALDLELTTEDKHAMRFAQRKAAIYMRAPAEATTTEVERLLTESEVGSIRTTVGDAIKLRRNPAELARDLRDAVNSPRIQNDMERVARTELAFAHAHGAYQALKQQAKAAGEPDPRVYKFVSPQACQDCKRIWGPMGSPHKYLLSYVEAREAAGGNFRKPRGDWGPVIGPVHPNCTEGPLQYFDEELVGAINEIADELMEIFNL